MPVAIPSIQVTANDGYNSIAFTNSDTPSYNRLQRNGVTLCRTIGVDDVFDDYTVAANVLYSYVGSAIDSGGQESAPSTTETSTVTVDLAYLFEVTKGATSNKTGTMLQLFNFEGQNEERQREGVIQINHGLTKPVIKVDEIGARRVECPIYIPDSEKATVVPALRTMLKSNALFCFRDPQGLVIFGTFPTQELKFDLNITGTLILVESSYSEEVPA
jgi:hypothetical protein